jgi:hypothetical protein
MRRCGLRGATSGLPLRRLDRIACSPVNENAMQFQHTVPWPSIGDKPMHKAGTLLVTMVGFHAAAPAWRA